MGSRADLRRWEERISELEDKSIEIIQSEEQREKLLKKNEQSFRGLWGEMNCTQQTCNGRPRGGEAKKGAEKIPGGSRVFQF